MLCSVGEGSTSSGRNSGSSAKRSSKYTSDSTLPDQHTDTQRTREYTQARLGPAGRAAVHMLPDLWHERVGLSSMMLHTKRAWDIVSGYVGEDFSNSQRTQSININSLIHRVKRLLERRGPGLDLLWWGGFFVGLRGGQCRFRGGRERRGGEGLLPSSLQRKGHSHGDADERTPHHQIVKAGQ